MRAFNFDPNLIIRRFHQAVIITEWFLLMIVRKNEEAVQVTVQFHLLTKSYH
jgi:hypothetical protein